MGENDDSLLDTEPETDEASVEPTEESAVEDSIENNEVFTETENVDTEPEIEVLMPVNITSSRRSLAPQKLKKTPVSRRSLPSKANKRDTPLKSLENDDSLLDTEPETDEASVEPTEESAVEDSIENN